MVFVADPPRFFASEFPNDNPALHDGAIWVCFTERGAPRPVVRPRSAMPRLALPAIADQVATAPAVREVRSEEPRPLDSAGEIATEIVPLDLELTPLDFDQEDAPVSALDLDVEAVASAVATDLARAIEEAESRTEEATREVTVDPPTDATSSATPTKPLAEVVAEPANTVAEAADPFRAFVAALVEVALGAGSTRAAATIPALMDGERANLEAFPDDVRAELVHARLAEQTDGGVRAAASFSETAVAWRKVLRGETDDLSGCGATTLDGWGVDVLRAFGVGRDGKLDVRRELRRRGVAAFGMLLAA